MSACTFASLAACFHLSGFYISSSVSVVDLGLEDVVITQKRETDTYNGIIAYSETKTLSVDRAVLNPYGRIAFGYEVDADPLSFSLEAWHMSSFASARDRGRNGISLTATWHFFRGSR